MNDAAHDRDAGELRKRTEAYAIQLIHFYASLPKSAEVQELGNQVLLSGAAVVASYREACSAVPAAAGVGKLGDCLEELAASSYRFELLAASGTVAHEVLAPLQDECNTLLAIFKKELYDT